MFAIAGPDPSPSTLLPLPLSMSRPSSVKTPEDPVTLQGLRHARIHLEARQYKCNAFARQVFEAIHILRIPSWVKGDIVSDGVKIQKVSGSLTNAVFCVSYPSKPYIRTLLLRIYGASSGSVISRPRELQTLHTLSSQYQIGPRVYGTFENGRFEEYFDCQTLTASDLRDNIISRWIGARMAELHQVDINAVEFPSAHHEDSVKKNVRSWIQPAQVVLALPAVKASDRAKLDLDVFLLQWEKYLRWLNDVEAREGSSRRVFAHNDTQYGNILRLTKRDKNVPEHCQIVVVDFEYASPNPAAFEIANHFHEWTANYHSSTPHILDPSKYPTFEERKNFYSAYIAHSYPTMSSPDKDKMMDMLDSQVRAWSPAPHAMWTLWGLIQAREDLEANEPSPEFDYMGYAQCRLEAFRREAVALGVTF